MNMYFIFYEAKVVLDGVIDLLKKCFLSDYSVSHASFYFGPRDRMGSIVIALVFQSVCLFVEVWEWAIKKNDLQL